MTHLNYQITVSFFVALAILFAPLSVFANSSLQDLPIKDLNSSAYVHPSENIIVNKQALEASRLLGVESEVIRLIQLKNSGKLNTLDRETLRLQLLLIRKIMTAGLELRTISAELDREIAFEQQALDKLTRDRDAIVAATNNANFLQLGILSIIIDGPLEETHSRRDNLYGNRLNIVSGLMVGGFAALALLEQRGGIRSSKAEPNMLGQTLGLDPPANKKLPPFLWTYLNSVCPDYTGDHPLTRREQLIEYWKTTKVLNIDINKQSTIEKVSVFGPHHKWWSESIKLINSRVTMLFDLRAMIDLLNTGLVDLLQILD